jgi:hypothetical protein
MPGESLFPCTVTIPDDETVYLVCRVHSGPDGTTIWWWDPALQDARPIVSSSFGIERDHPAGRHYSLGLDDGDEPVRIIWGTGCACGHPMKRWTLPKPARAGT